MSTIISAISVVEAVTVNHSLQRQSPFSGKGSHFPYIHPPYFLQLSLPQEREAQNS